jgi:hypothetical protein
MYIFLELCEASIPTGGWRKLQNKELLILYASPSIIMVKIRRMRWVGNVSRMRKRKDAYRL